MALSDSMFLFEIIVEDFKRFMRCKEFSVRSEFPEIFSLNLSESNEESLQEERKIKPKRKLRNIKKNTNISSKTQLKSNQTLVLANNIEWLIAQMILHPLELSIWSKKNPEKKLGGACIPWSKSYKDYLNKLSCNPNLPPVVVNGKYNIINEKLSKCMASITLSIKLRRIQGTPLREINYSNGIEDTAVIYKGPDEITEYKGSLYLRHDHGGPLMEWNNSHWSDDKAAIYKRPEEITENKENLCLRHDQGVLLTELNNSNGSENMAAIYKRPEEITEYKENLCLRHDQGVLLTELNNSKGSEDMAAIYKRPEEITEYKENLCLRHDQGVLLTELNNSNGSEDIAAIYKRPDEITEYKESLYNNDDTSMSNNFNDYRTENVRINEKSLDDSLLRIVESETSILKHCSESILKSRSLSSIEVKTKPNPLTYIFASSQGQFGNHTYCVSYFTVENDVSGKADTPNESHAEVNQPKGRYHFKLCDSQCPMKKDDTGSCTQSVCSLDLPEEASHLIAVTKCKQVECDSKQHRQSQPKPDDRILLDLTNLNAKCCDFTEKIEEVVGGVKGKIQIGDDPCFCTCECTFGFTKKTTYCTVCGGYEVVGDELAPPVDDQPPFPCPVFHKLIDKNKLKNLSTSGSESKKKGDDQSLKSMKVSSGQKAAATTKRQVAPKSVESEKDSKKGTKKKKDDRFQFNYGYKGIPPQIGHSECAMPCTGTLNNVPKNMGWLWTAEDVPGMKFRPNWKPGATNKHVVRLLKMAKSPGEVITKKRRKDAGKKKRPLKRPLLVVQKRDGEYSVTMETMKTYTKPRAPNQHPYEDKPVVTYTIGRTDEENRDRQKKRESEQRRLERQQRKFIQSAFQDMCQEICLKTYQQALGLLPGAEDPECPCFSAQSDKVNVDVSCSCSDDKSTIGSDTDLDEWIVEFTPPVATFDPTFKPKKIFKADMGTEYSYLDYRVKLVDRFGNPVPRFFKGPDGRQQCSDLGGFWSPDHKWLEINIDGYVAPDGRWAPNTFIGPSGEQVDAEAGKFQATNGKWLVVGVDGYVDCVGKWRSYPRPKGTTQMLRSPVTPKKKVGTGDRKEPKREIKPSEASWSCFGDVTPKYLSRMGIIGHGQDKKLLLSKLRDMLAHGEEVKIPQPSTVYRLPDSKRSKRARLAPRNAKSYLEDRYKCRHPVPSDKGVVARDERGNKTYFHLRGAKNKRPKERLAHLASQGISVSSFHLPCFHSFINSEIMKRQQRQRIIALAGKNVATQI